MCLVKEGSRVKRTSWEDVPAIRGRGDSGLKEDETVEVDSKDSWDLSG